MQTANGGFSSGDILDRVRDRGFVLFMLYLEASLRFLVVLLKNDTLACYNFNILLLFV